jgi:hypothetical protein
MQNTSPRGTAIDTLATATTQPNFSSTSALPSPSRLITVNASIERRPNIFHTPLHSMALSEAGELINWKHPAESFDRAIVHLLLATNESEI